MRVLWICNVPIPEAAELYNIKGTPIEGWLVEVAKEISSVNVLELEIAFHSSFLPAGVTYRSGEKIKYIGINNTNKSLDEQIVQFKDIISATNPDVIHVWGTESIHSYALSEAAKLTGKIDKVVLSIQGLVSMYAYHYMGGLPGKVQIFPTIRDIIRKDTLKKQQERFLYRGEFEKKAIQNVRHVIGRTFWDKAATQMVNPALEYYFNNETLRKSFYSKRWSYSNCQKHSLFVSQAQYPIKGFHYILEAVKLLAPQYSDVVVYVSGNDNSFKNKYKLGSYGKYVQELIKKYHLSNNIKYLGMLNEKQMCEQFLNSEVFVSPSVIENSPNSVCEAMLLGMPIVSSNVGGVADLLNHGKEGYLYQSDAPYLLAYYIKRFFDSVELEEELGRNAREHALQTHDKNTNVKRLLDIYDEISKYEG